MKNLKDKKEFDAKNPWKIIFERRQSIKNVAK